MKKLSILALSLLAGTVCAAAQSVPVEDQRNTEPQQVKVTYSPSSKATMPKAAAKGAAPASIVGKNYVTTYGSFINYGERAGSIMVQAAGDSVLLKRHRHGIRPQGQI